MNDEEGEVRRSVSLSEKEQAPRSANEIGDCASMVCEELLKVTYRLPAILLLYYRLRLAVQGCEAMPPCGQEKRTLLRKELNHARRCFKRLAQAAPSPCRRIYHL
jgi:hypothetical protein